MKTYIINCLLVLQLAVAMPCCALDEPLPIQGFRIAQERLENNGVLTSRPVKLDQKILTIIQQNRISNIQDYAAWLDKTMVYQDEHGRDQWLEPDEFLNSKRGDCEDFALLNSRVLQVLGYQPHIVTLHSSYSAHAVCAFEYRGKFYWLDNAQLKTSNAATLIRFAQELTEQLHYTHSYELDPLSKQSHLIYQRS